MIYFLAPKLRQIPEMYADDDILKALEEIGAALVSAGIEQRVIFDRVDFAGGELKIGYDGSPEWIAWCLQSESNWAYLSNLCSYLSIEYMQREGKDCAYKEVGKWSRNNVPSALQQMGLTPPPILVPESYTQTLLASNYVYAHRRLYVLEYQDKRRKRPTWRGKKTAKPEWWDRHEEAVVEMTKQTEVQDDDEKK